MTYPRNIAEHAAAAYERVATQDGLPQGVAANLSCGSYVRFLVSIDDSGRIDSVTLRSNGCGYMLASANVLADHISGRDIRDLHGSKGNALRAIISKELDEWPADREECARTCIEALTAAFLDLRSRRVEEFRGEEALICTCFGVTEERISALISTAAVNTVDDVTDLCNAGGGCGACRMLIEELIDHG